MKAHQDTISKYYQGIKKTRYAYLMAVSRKDFADIATINSRFGAYINNALELGIDFSIIHDAIDDANNQFANLQSTIKDYYTN